MKIDFSQMELNKAEAYGPSVSGAGKKEHLSAAEVQAAGVFTEIGSNALDNLHAYSKKKRSVADKLTGIENQDEKINRNYMAVMSNTLSGKDFKELVEKGYAPGQMQPKDAVNSLDRMKIKLAESGLNVAGYTDTVSKEKAAEITGSLVSANRLSESAQGEPLSNEMIAAELKGADLPATDENIKDIKNAFTIASELKPLNDTAVTFMVENGMEPTIENVYEAQFSTGGATSSNRAGYFYEGTGYISAAADENIEENEVLSRQIESVIEEAGLEVNDESIKDADFLIKKGIPLTKDALRLYSDIRHSDLKADISEMTDAIASGKRPVDAYLIKDYRNIKAERQLKESELIMTHEANRKLLDSDFSIDTKGLEAEVEALKKNEKALWDLVDETVLARDEIKEAPAELIGRMEFFHAAGTDFFNNITDRDYLTLSDLRDEGAALRSKYEKLEADYEAVGTEVRPDLGDSIKKAFNNVDALIEEAGLSPDDENRRAVRILGYSGMEINEENIGRIKEADNRVNSMIESLTPKNVLRLIRENINPLNMNIDELNEKLASYEAEDEEQGTDFAKYLVKLQNSGDVTQEEAASYIGIYRLIDKLNRTDGAAVGALINQNAELSPKNLISALRTSRHGHMDMLIDESFGGVQAVNDETILKIDTQISTAFSDEYYEEEAQKFTEAAKAEEQLFSILKRADIEPSADNINAAAELFASNGGFVKKLFEPDEEGEKKEDRLKEAADRAFAALDDPEEFAAAYDEMVNEEIIAAFEGERLDIRVLQAGHKVTAIQRTLADSENFTVPVEIDGEITSINLQIRHGENRGNVDIYFESSSLGMISASFSLTKDGLKGIAACGKNAGYDYLTGHSEEIIKRMSTEGRPVTMDVIRSDDRIKDRPADATDGAEEVETSVLYRAAKAFIGGFIYENQQ